MITRDQVDIAVDSDIGVVRITINNPTEAVRLFKGVLGEIRATGEEYWWNVYFDGYVIYDIDLKYGWCTLQNDKEHLMINILEDEHIVIEFGLSGIGDNNQDELDRLDYTRDVTLGLDDRLKAVSLFRQLGFVAQGG